MLNLQDRWRNTPRLRRWFIRGVAAAVVLVAAAALIGRAGARHVQPVLRSRIVNTLGERFGSPVALDGLNVYYNGGFQVDGRGLCVQSVLRGVPGDAARPMLRVDAFHFRVGILTALSNSPRIHHVRIRGVQLDLPAVVAERGGPIASKHEVDLEYAEVDDAHVRFAAAMGDRAPLIFDLPHMELRGVSRSKPIRFKAVVDNGSPIGITTTEGTIGPWNFDDPRLTPIRGSFGFEDKDVSSVRGLRGRLSLNGTYTGTVGQMHAEGTTTDPAFGLDVSSHTVAMRTNFAFTLDAVRGGLAIERLEGAFGRTQFVCTGEAVKNRDPEGFRLDLQLHAPQARVEDVLALGTRTTPAVMQGTLQVDGLLRMRAGAESVSRKLSLERGRFAVAGGRFTNAGVQQTVDALGERARGNPGDADAEHASPVTATMHGTVRLDDAVLRFTETSVSLPGAQAALHGTYSLDGTQFVFDGTVHTEAKLSHMTGGVKHLLLKPFNGLFHHGGQDGATLPLHIEGVGDVPHFGTKIAGLKVGAPKAH